MKIIRITLAVLISLAMLYIARSNSRGQPEHLTHSDGQYRFDMITVPKVKEYQSDTLKVSVSCPREGKRVLFRTSQLRGLSSNKMAEFDAIEMQPVNGRKDEYFVVVTAGNRGGRSHYFFDVVDSTGSVAARFTNSGGSPFSLRYIGTVPAPVLTGHIFFIFATVFCVAMATLHSVPLIRGGGDVRPVAGFLFWAVLFCVIGGYPLGISMNYYAFNSSWEGVPFGTDATDNKTQLLLLYLLFASLSTLGSFSRGRYGRDLFAPRTLGWIGLGSFAVMLFIYLIPHSIQFTPAFTYTFCYAWTAVVASLYFFGRWRVRTDARS